ncbi:Hypothetical predicted protein [Cloeon dipterum]|uniref:PAN2-PAN3 deadenylation complex catalytic subunit PAN2 n=1 Tax=Cloeon dipterum TaxID=197152 RepID=A0A8S1CSE5_9INSE|nr:Hypothetical predicted protein [Cloeon dipterum]
MDFTVPPFKATVPGQSELLMYGDDAGNFEEGEYPLTAENYEEAYNDAEFQEIHTFLADGGDRFGVSAVAFDLQEQLLWMGNQGGHVTSYYGPGMQKYTSFQVHSNQDVRQISTFEEGVLALTQSTLRCQQRRGIPVFTHSSDNMMEMQCMLQMAPSTMVMGGHQSKLILFDISRAAETGVVGVGENGCAIIRRHGRYLCTGNPLGVVELRDPRSLHLEHSLEAHTGSLSDFDVHENLLVTCGFSARSDGMAVDRLLMVYDLRMMRAISPMQVLVDPLLLRFLPTFSSRLAVVSAVGQFQLIDTVALDEPDICLYHTNSVGAMCLTFDVSSNCQCMAFGDNDGSIHVFSSQPEAIFNNFSSNTTFADAVETLPALGINDAITPLSSIPMPYCQGRLASDWPEKLLRKVYRPTPPIDPFTLKNLKMVGNIGYAPNPGVFRRNQVAYKPWKSGPKGMKKMYGSDAANSKDDGSFVAIPKKYRKIEVKYSKMGVDDFDFDYYNKTGFSGLEAMLPNSYCNAMLQLLYYTDTVRAALESHLCQREFCLACELGFLYFMVDRSQGFPCQASNFLRAFRTIPEASALGLILSDENNSKMNANLPLLIQNFNRFILHQIHFEILDAKKCENYLESARAEFQGPITAPFVYQEKDFPSIMGSGVRNSRNYKEETIEAAEIPQESQESRPVSPVAENELSNIFSTRQTSQHKCIKCGREGSKETTQLLWNLTYPDMSEVKAQISFCDVLTKSLGRVQVIKTWCEVCNNFMPTKHSRKISKLPPILALNCGIDSPNDKEFWQIQMDYLVQKAQEGAQSLKDDSPAPVAGPPSSGKPCRYGDKCMRTGCRFKHAGRAGESATPVSNSHLYYNNAWLPLHIQADVGDNGQLFIRKKSESGDEADNVPFSSSQHIEYDLHAVVCYVNDPANPDKKNLVSLINVGPRYHERSLGSPVSQWYIFNDFSITPVQAQEAVWFSLDWKIPCVLYWISKELKSQPEPLIQNPITLDVFREDNNLAQSGRKMITFTPLSAEEMPSQGDLVAMDAEFVTLNQEESELRSDGKTNTIKPSHMSVARITCIRGQGPQVGEPFIDDYISTSEQVVDYLTKFSGIKPGDLDANFSSKHLTTLKSTYQKLRFLVDIGVKFVGHGLKNDFRVINLVVPSEQVIDTVHLFHLPHHRMVSLKFLAWHFLNTKIQSVTHDSTEDAKTALQLYHHYKKLEATGGVAAALKELYATGKRMQWKVPGTE